MTVFTRFTAIECPESLTCLQSGGNPRFTVTFRTDGEIPFPQVIIHGQGRQKLFNGPAIQLVTQTSSHCLYSTDIEADLLQPGEITVQIEGCRKTDLGEAGGLDWIKCFRVIRLMRAAEETAKQRTRIKDESAIRIFFGIHKHMHQPYYNTGDLDYWDGEKEQIFGSRAGNYTDFVAAAIQQYADGDLAHAGLSTSWSGSLIEQLERCRELGRCNGRFNQWSEALRDIAAARTALGHPRLSFSAFGIYHPLMPLIPSRDIIKQIDRHRTLIRSTFGVSPSSVLFPPETAFHVRMIPALLQAGITAVIYDSVHRFRTCRNYPYAGPGEGLLPPNPAEQVNAPAQDWLQLQNIWAGSQISPSLLRPEYVGYEDADGVLYKIIAIPAERYIGNEDARGGFGALLYPEVFEQVFRKIAATGEYDAQHPPFFLLHSDGDNHGGGAESYYKNNTGDLVNWLQQDSRFQLTTIDDYLQQYPPDPSRVIHIEPGAWSGADNGDPQFMKWFSRYEESYSPDLNSWAVLTAVQNALHSLQDGLPDDPALAAAERLLLIAETSCYWYWTGQTVWDQQVTQAANRIYELLKTSLDQIENRGLDRTGPTIFPPWVIPANPGGQAWGPGRLISAPDQGTVHTLAADISGIKRITAVIKTSAQQTRLEMTRLGNYPCHTGAARTAEYFSAQLPIGAGDMRYFIEAEDQRGNISRSSLERIYLQ